MKTLSTGGAVLVVEDDPLVRLDMALALSDAGFAVIEAGTADEGSISLPSASISGWCSPILKPRDAMMSWTSRDRSKQRGPAFPCSSPPGASGPITLIRPAFLQSPMTRGR